MNSAVPVFGLFSLDIQKRNSWQEGGGRGASRRCKDTRRARRPCMSTRRRRVKAALATSTLDLAPRLGTWVLDGCLMVNECRWLVMDDCVAVMGWAIDGWMCVFDGWINVDGWRWMVV
jgi:hypothetical protein